jgi:hypothetical protein
LCYDNRDGETLLEVVLGFEKYIKGVVTYQYSDVKVE